MAERTPGQHRRYDRHDLVALRQAVIVEALIGQAAIERAKELRASGLLLEPRVLRDRMACLEEEVRKLRGVMEEIGRQVSRT